MKGKVWIKASTYMAYEIQRWKICSFSCDTPVNPVMGLLFVDVANTKGMHASDIHPLRVAMGGELPKEISRVLGQ